MPKKLVSMVGILVVPALALWFLPAQSEQNKPENPHRPVLVDNQNTANNTSSDKTTNTKPFKSKSNADLPPGKLDSVGAMVDGLRRRLEAEPNDMKGWVLLSKSYHHLQRWEEASEAMAKAKALGYTGAIASIPDASASNKNLHSTTSGTNSSTDRQMAEIMRKVINDSTEKSTTERSGLTVKVDLAPDLRNKFSAETAVFIFARTVETPPGPPLAVVRKQVRDLPLQIVLDDGMAMMPGRTISSVNQLIVGVRVSNSGSPVAQAGDYQVLSDKIPSSFDNALELIIKDEVGG